MTFNKTFTKKLIELKVPARILTTGNTNSTTYYFKSDEIIRIAFENKEIAITLRGKNKKDLTDT